MSLKAVECEGYKAFRQPTRIELRRLTVIFGRNNSGKTTLARLPIFAVSSLTNSDNLYALSSGSTKFGSSFLDIVSVEQAHPKLSVGLSWTSEHYLGVTLQRVTVGIEQHSVQPLRVQLDSFDTVELILEREPAKPAYWAIQDVLNESQQVRLNNHRRYLNRVLRETVHIPSHRPPIDETYASREPAGWTVPEVPYQLSNDRALMVNVHRWFHQSMQVELDIDHAAFAFRLVEVGPQRSNVSLAEGGRGTQSVLPVAAILLAIARAKLRARLVVVEEPEEHLHPSAHGAVADLLIESSSKAQTVVETHSENLILRLRRRIADGTLAPSDLALYYLTDTHEVIPVELDEYGSAKNWPIGIFESDAEEAQAIVEAKLAAMGGTGSAAT